MDNGIIDNPSVVERNGQGNTMIDRYFSTARFRTGENDKNNYFYNLDLKRLDSLQEKKIKLEDMISAGVVSDKLRYEKQREHLPGTKARARRIIEDKRLEKTPSGEFFDGVNLNELLSADKHNEVIVFAEGRVRYYFSLDKNIGKVYNKKKKDYVKTRRVIAEFSKKGLHFYPVKEW